MVDEGIPCVRCADKSVLGLESFERAWVFRIDKDFS